jgi:hypothetical protein
MAGMNFYAQNSDFENLLNSCFHDNSYFLFIIKFSLSQPANKVRKGVPQMAVDQALFVL